MNQSDFATNMESREIIIQGEDMKFCCAHFVAYRGFRERLHGHNYTVKLKLSGDLGPDGYIIDFGIVKRSLRGCCKQLNEYLIVPMKSDVLEVTIKNEQVEIVAKETNSFFSLPKKDCVLLPIVHSTAEEIAEYLWYQVKADLSDELLEVRGVVWMEVQVFERPTQGAVFRKSL